MRLKFTGPEHVREVHRAALGVHPDSEETFVFDASNNFICEVDEDEAMVLHRGSGGTWARVLEGTSTDPDEEAEVGELPVVADDVDDESSSESDEPQEA
jgi:hypothetical protein